ncbi:hypothetical protein [Spiroplasma apis]|uniref:Transmembrane protein n=1 Tax=Spiroplasma apis B31 TaxID=1276258 RepID=V5RK88_SPIAP|nr:hypothetical protein [Spiroplasma apis]AHB36501.1 hypothetical protein SAPIS_v1c06560 [Spiroplasma apis B31]
MIISKTKIITGLIMILICTLVYLSMLTITIIRLRKLQKLDKDRVYIRKPVYHLFYWTICFIVPFFLSVNITLGTMSLVLGENDKHHLGLVFNILYLFYILIILLIILTGQKIINSMYIAEYQGNYFFINNLISKESIISIQPTLRRKSLIITFKNEEENIETMTIKYHWELYDWFKVN